jgi:hypothetical protein
MEQGESRPTALSVGLHDREWLSSLQIQKHDEVLKTEVRTENRKELRQEDDLLNDNEVDGFEYEGPSEKKVKRLS